jgi:protein-S-isoprenylcysteine O-methyltransferase
LTLRSVATLVVLAFPISEGLLALWGRSKARVVRRADDGSLGFLWLTITLSVTAAAWSGKLVPFATVPWSPRARDLLALVLLGGGLVLRWVSIAVLGRFFTVDVAIHEDHAVVESGPYRYLRHPSYTGILIAFAGLGVYFGNWVGLLAIVVPITLAFLRRIRTEEEALIQSLGPAYADYCARTARLIPGLY